MPGLHIDDRRQSLRRKEVGAHPVVYVLKVDGCRFRLPAGTIPPHNRLLRVTESSWSFGRWLEPVHGIHYYFYDLIISHCGIHHQVI